MKKAFKYYAIIWVIILAAFNVLCFATPNEWGGYYKLGGAFWSAYIFMTLAFLGQLVCAYFAFRADSMQKLFYNMPLITISYAGLVIMLLFGGVAMAIPDLPNWVGVIVGFIVLAFTAVAVVKASAAAEAVQAVDKKIQDNTAFIRNLTAEAEQLVRMAPNDEIRKECKKVYEAVRYSDPVSKSELSVIDAKITVKMDEFCNAVSKANTEDVRAIASDLILLISDRNNKIRDNK